MRGFLTAISKENSNRLSDRDRRFDRGVRIVFAQNEILEPEIVDAFHGWIQLHPRQRPKPSRKLFPRLLEMILIKMQIAKGVDEFARPQIANLRDHDGEQGIRC